MYLKRPIPKFLRLLKLPSQTTIAAFIAMTFLFAFPCADYGTMETVYLISLETTLFSRLAGCCKML